MEDKRCTVHCRPAERTVVARSKCGWIRSIRMEIHRNAARQVHSTKQKTLCVCVGFSIYRLPPSLPPTIVLRLLCSHSTLYSMLTADAELIECGCSQRVAVQHKMKFAKPCYLVYQCACTIRLLCLQSRFNYHYGYHCDAIKICIHLVYLLSFRCFLVVTLPLLVLLHSRLSALCVHVPWSILFHLCPLLNPLISSSHIIYPHALSSVCVCAHHFNATIAASLSLAAHIFHTHTSSRANETHSHFLLENGKQFRCNSYAIQTQERQFWATVQISD